MTTLRDGVVVIPKNIGRQSILRDKNKNKVANPQPVSHSKETLKAVDEFVENTFDAPEEHPLKWVATPPGAHILDYLGTLYDKEGLEAFEELVDNAFDADSKHVVIKIINKPGEKSIEEVIVADNGTGISIESLLEAMRLAADTNQRANGIGKFGTGMKSAAFNLGSRLVVYTRSEDEDFGYRVEMDIDTMMKQGGVPGVMWGVMSPVDQEYFMKHVPDTSKHGTVVYISGIKNDDRRAKTASAYRNKLQKRLAITYRDLLQNPTRRKITVMGASRSDSIQQVEPSPLNDPIGWDTYPDGQLCPWTTVQFKGSSFQYRVMFISKALAAAIEDQPDYGITGRRAPSQIGYSFIRAGRRIASNLFESIVGVKQGSNYNGLKVEVKFEPDLDNEFGVKYTKNGVSLSQSLKDTLESTTKHYRTNAWTDNRKKLLTEPPPSQEEETTAKFDAYNKQFLPRKERSLSLPRPNKSVAPSTGTVAGSTETSTNGTKKKRRSKFTYDFHPSNDVNRDELWRAKLKVDNTIEAGVSNIHPLVDFFHKIDPEEEELRMVFMHLFFALCLTDLEFESEEEQAYLKKFKRHFALNLESLMA